MKAPVPIHIAETQFFNPRRLSGALPHVWKAWDDRLSRVRSALALSNTAWWEVSTTREVREARPDHTAEKMRVQDANQLVASSLAVILDDGNPGAEESQRLEALANSQGIPVVIIEQSRRPRERLYTLDDQRRTLRIQWRHQDDIDEVLERHRTHLMQIASQATARRARFLQDLALAEFPLQMFIRRVAQPGGVRINDIAFDLSPCWLWGLESFPYLACTLTEEFQRGLRRSLGMPSLRDAVDMSVDRGPGDPEVYGLRHDDAEILEAHRSLMAFLHTNQDFVSDRAVLEMSRNIGRAVRDLGYTAAEICEKTWPDRFRDWTPQHWAETEVRSYRDPADEPR